MDDEFGQVVKAPIPVHQQDEFGTVVAPSVPDEFGTVVTPPARGGLTQTARTSSDEVNAIASKHGVDPADLQKLVSFYGGIPQQLAPDDVQNFAAGEIGESVGAGLPQFIYKKFQSPAMQAAIDDLSDLTRKNKSYLQSGAELGGSVVTGLGLGKAAAAATIPRLYHIIAPAVGGAVQGLTHSKTGEELPGAAIGGTIGAVIPAAFSAAGNLTRRGASTAGTHFLTGTKTADELIASRLASEGPAIEVTDALLAGKKSATDLTDQEMKDLVGDGQWSRIQRFSTPETLDQMKSMAVDSELQGIKKKLGDVSDLPPEEISRRYHDIKADELASSIGKEGKEAGYQPTSRTEEMLLKSVDPVPVFDMFDKKLGTKSAKLLNDASIRKNQFANTFSSLLDKMPDDPTPAQASEFFSTATGALNKMGYAVKQSAQIPEMYLPGTELKQALIDKYKQNPVAPDLIKSLQDLTGQTITNRHEIDKGMQAVLADQFTSRTGKDIPDWLKDTNLSRVLNRYVTGTERDLSTRELLPEIDRMQKIARGADDMVIVNYLDRYKQDVLGGRPSVTDEVKNKLLTEWDKFTTDKLKDSTGIDKALWRAKAEVPQAIGNLLQSSVYHNGLGFNLASTLQNLVSPYTMAISDLGPDKATKYAVGAMIDLAKTVRDGIELKASPALAAKMGVQAGETVTVRNPALVALNQGLMGSHWRGELLDPLVRDVKKNKLAGAINDFSSRFGSIVMGPFQWAENQGRGVVAFMGKRMADDIRQNPDLINQMIKSPAYRHELNKLLQQGASPEQFNQQVVNYLNSHTMLNFDNLNMSEFGRNVGPLFRQYTKIPSYVAGRGLQMVHDKGLVNGLAEGTGAYLAPLAGYTMVDNLMDSSDNPRLKKIVGTEGFKNWAVGSSLVPWFDTKGGLFRNPLVRVGEAAVQAGKGLATGDQEPADVVAKFGDTVYNSFGPGAGVLRLLGEDIPALVDNQEPDRSQPLKTVRRIEAITGGK